MSAWTDTMDDTEREGWRALLTDEPKVLHVGACQWCGAPCPADTDWCCRDHMLAWEHQ